MKKSVSENLFYNMLYQVVVTVLPVITMPYVSRVLGLHANGIHSYTESIVTYFILIGSLGISLYGLRKVAYVSEDKEALSKSAWEIILLKIILLMVTLIFYVPILCINGQYASIYRIQLINVIANGIDLTWLFQGIEDFKKITLRNLIVKLLYVVSLFLFIKGPDDLNKYIFLITFSCLVGNLFMWYYAKNYISFRVKVKLLHPLSHLKGTITLFIPQIMNYVYALLDRSMLGWITGNTDTVGIYDQAQRIVRMVTAILQSLSYVIMARVANLSSNNDMEGISYYIKKSINFTLFLGIPAVFGLIGVADQFIPVFLGVEYLDVALILKLLSILILTMSMNSIFGIQILIPLGNEKYYAMATTVGAVSNVVINIVTIPRLGIIGACISSIIAEMFVLIIAYIKVRKVININIYEVLKDNFKVILASGIMYICVLGISKLHYNNFVKLVGELIIGGGIYIVLLTSWKNEILLVIWKKALGLIKKKH